MANYSQRKKVPKLDSCSSFDEDEVAVNRNLPRLPIECWSLIFSFSTHNKTRLSQLSLISRTCYQAIQPKLWKEVELKSWKEVTVFEKKSKGKGSSGGVGGMVKELAIEVHSDDLPISSLIDRTLSSILHSTTNLIAFSLNLPVALSRPLSLSPSSKLEILILYTPTFLHHLLPLLSIPTLTYLELIDIRSDVHQPLPPHQTGYGKLTRMEIKGGTMMNRDFDWLIASQPGLRCLELDLSGYEYITSSFLKSLAMMKDLEELKLFSRFATVSSSSNDLLLPLLNSSTSIESVFINSTLLSPDNFSELPSSIKSLSIDISSVEGLKVALEEGELKCLAEVVGMKEKKSKKRPAAGGAKKVTGGVGWKDLKKVCEGLKISFKIEGE